MRRACTARSQWPRFSAGVDRSIDANANSESSEHRLAVLPDKLATGATPRPKANAFATSRPSLSAREQLDGCKNQSHSSRSLQQGFDPMKLGYARVSTSEQDMQARRAALLATGCERVFGEGASCQSPAESVDSSTSAGRHGGRPRALNDIQERGSVAMPSASRSAASAARLVGVSRSTVSRLQSRICRNEVSRTSLRR